MNLLNENKFKKGDWVVRTDDDTRMLPVGTICKVIDRRIDAIYIEGYTGRIYHPKNFKPLDLTQIDIPLGELPREVQEMLVCAKELDKKGVECFIHYDSKWKGILEPSWSPLFKYRLKRNKKSPELIQKEEILAQITELQSKVESIVVPEEVGV